MSLAFFSLSVLELFGVLEEKLSTKERETYRDWIYEQQLPSGGFRGSSASGPLIVRALFKCNDNLNAS